MYTVSHKSFVECAALAVGLVLFASGPASADELIDNLGPVSAHEPILTSLGDKRVIAFYRPGSQRCAVHAVVWDNTNDDDAKSAARVRVSLEPDQTVHLDTADDKTLSLQCGKDAETLSISDNDERVAFGMASETANGAMKANASGF